MSFLRLPSIFRRSKSTPEQVTKEPSLTKEETTTIKDIFPVTRYATNTVKKQQFSKKERVSTTTSTTNMVPKRKSPRKKRIDTTFRSVLRNDNQNNISTCWTEDIVEHIPQTRRTNTVEEGVATAAAAKLLLEASQRMQDQESVDSRITGSISHFKSSSYPTDQLEQQKELVSNTKNKTTSSDSKIPSADIMGYIHQILKGEEDICRWQQVMLNFLASKTDSYKESSELDETEQQPWEQLLQEQKKQLVLVKEMIEKVENSELFTMGEVERKNLDKPE